MASMSEAARAAARRGSESRPPSRRPAWPRRQAAPRSWGGRGNGEGEGMEREREDRGRERERESRGKGRSTRLPSPNVKAKPSGSRSGQLSAP